jgi:glycosidase
MTNKKQWWQKTTIYQIYPRSFMDSNNDGIGDLHGIISKLDYIKDLGFDTIWLSPTFTSPQQDWGYDISNYLGIAPEYGQIGDVEQLIDQVHQREMRVLFDLVLNHTSIQHPWFIESCSCIDNPKRDWYIWKDGRGSRPPNNWQSIVVCSGWHIDPKSNQ